MSNDTTWQIILFYKYVHIDDVDTVSEHIRDTCLKHNLCGRAILAKEGINANLAGPKLKDGQTSPIDELVNALKKHPLFGDDIDFKMDYCISKLQPFPDLVIKVKTELCSTGGHMPLELLTQHNLGGTHLTPEDFHDTIREHWVKKEEDKETKKDLVILDVRNKREFALGHFQFEDKIALDPNTKLFSEWSAYADKSQEELKNKKVLMYCTGGIRCEKASAYLRSIGVNDVSQLSGGIHRYIEKYGTDGFFAGKNAVFDARGLQVGEGESEIIGKCCRCNEKEETLSSDRICCVCRDRLIVCNRCRQEKKGIYTCVEHQHLENIYTPFLDVVSLEDLYEHKSKLERLFSTKLLKDSKNRRKTVRKQLERVSNRIELLECLDEIDAIGEVIIPRCRGCGRYGPQEVLDLLNLDPEVIAKEKIKNSAVQGDYQKFSEICDGKCWGFMQESKKDELFKIEHFSAFSNAKLELQI
eukprot:Awhi_evm1s15662